LARGQYVGLYYRFYHKVFSPERIVLDLIDFAAVGAVAVVVVVAAAVDAAVAVVAFLPSSPARSWPRRDGWACWAAAGRAVGAFGPRQVGGRCWD
jgi:hypothetical protein